MSVSNVVEGRTNQHQKAAKFYSQPKRHKRFEALRRELVNLILSYHLGSEKFCSFAASCCCSLPTLAMY